MDLAKCTMDGDEYSAVNFAKLPPSELAIKRRHLICIRCSTRAIFVKEARSGQSPHFRARPHANCPLAALESEQGEGGGEDKDMLRNPGDHIMLDLRYGAVEQINGNPESDVDGGNRGGRHVGPGRNRQAVSKRRLRPILKNLILSEEFRRSEQTIEISGLTFFECATYSSISQRSPTFMSVNSKDSGVIFKIFVSKKIMRARSIRATRKT